MTHRAPPAVPRGGRVAVVAPGSTLRDPEAVRAGMRRLAEWGYEPVPGRSLFARSGDLAGDDAARLEDLRWALTDPTLDAAWAARGGWGTSRLLSGLDLRGLARRPRWLIGFSDLTSLQLALFARGLASWYAPCVADLADPRRFRAADLRQMLAAPGAPRTLRGRRVAGPSRRASGPLAGGCLSLLAAAAGTRWQPDLRGAVVFLEDVGEAPYRIDRMLWQVRAAGILDGITGLALGQFTACDPPPGRPSRSLAAVLREHALALEVPVLGGLPIGHGLHARAVPIGYRATLDPGAGTLVLRPPR
ncbi:MAG: LD-carboxypeptidase [Acidobacteria bacterium]|nr:LD-carboxypeptidase [Acidobacteriota bacterium]